MLVPLALHRAAEPACPRAITRPLAFWLAAGAMVLQAAAALLPRCDLSPVTQGLPGSIFSAGRRTPTA